MASAEEKIEETKENKVLPTQTTIRWRDLAVRQRLLDYVHARGHGLPPKKQPSIDAVIQEAILFYLDATFPQTGASIPPKTGAADPNNLLVRKIEPTIEPAKPGASGANLHELEIKGHGKGTGNSSGGGDIKGGSGRPF